MQKRIMIGQIPLVIRETDDSSADLVNPPARELIGQGSTIATDSELPSDSDLMILGNNCDIESVENGQEEISTARQDQAESSSGRKRKRPYRHTKHQIEVLEAYFNQCPHPEEKQRKELGQELGLEPIQVKFWFQNKRTQTKSQQEQKQNNQLRAENDMLRAENLCCRQAISSTVCHICGDPASVRPIPMGEHQLRLENNRLREQIERMKRITGKYVGKEYLESSLRSDTSSVSQNVVTKVDLLADKTVSGQYLAYLTVFLEANGPLIRELAMASMEELVKKIESREPLWIPNRDGRGYVLNADEYFKVIPNGFHPNPIGWRSEASKESALVMLTPFNVVDLFMDLGKWLAVYSSFISKATSFHQLSTGRGGTQDGAVQLIYAEFQTPCPLVPTRESIFLRYCKQLAVQTWAIVDVSLDNILPSSVAVPSSKCLRWPSGCIIEEAPNGFSKVTWVEHVVVEDQDVNLLAEAILQFGVAYGARRWVSILERQSERLANAITQTSHEFSNEIVPGKAERKSLLKLTERMLLRFYSGVTSSNAYGWIHVSGDGVDEVKIMKWDTANEPGMNSGIVVCASLCLWLPLPPTIVFDFMRNEATRKEWDVLCTGGTAQETVHIASGQDNGNCVSVLQILGNEEQRNMLIMQDSSSDKIVSSLIYAPVEVESMIALLSDANSDKLGLLPCGFTILPSQLPARIRGNCEAFSVGSLLTTSFQILISPHACADPHLSNNSIEMVKCLVQNTAHDIKNALMARIH